MIDLTHLICKVLYVKCFNIQRTALLLQDIFSLCRWCQEGFTSRGAVNRKDINIQMIKREFDERLS